MKGYIPEMVSKLFYVILAVPIVVLIFLVIWITKKSKGEINESRG
jgi:hypothetical protein